MCSSDLRHLLYLKYIEQLLCNTWTEHAKSLNWRRGSGHPAIEAWKSRAFALRQRMLVFVQQFAYYVTSEVLEPQWRNLAAHLAKVINHYMMLYITILRRREILFMYRSRRLIKYCNIILISWILGSRNAC